MTTARSSDASAACVRPAFGWLLAALLVLWILEGAWPFTPVEGDEMAVVNGLHAWQHGLHHWRTESYLYAVQPGSYWLIVALARLTGLDFFTAFALGSALAAVGFAVAAAAWLTRVLNLRPPWAFVLLVLLAQEISAAAAYANTSTFGGATVFAGLICFGDGSVRLRCVFAGLLFGLAAWLRFDALLATPVIVVLADKRSGRLGVLATTAMTTLLAVVVAYTASGDALFDIWRTYAAKKVNIGFTPLWGSLPFLLSYSGLVLGVAGMVWCAWRRDWRVLLLVVTGILPSLIVHGRAMTTTKYLYYTVPYWLLPCGWLGRELARSVNRLRPSWRTILLGGIVLMIAGEWFLAPRTTPDELRRTPIWTGMKITVRADSAHQWNLALGSGDSFANDDGFRVRAGLAFAPVVWREAKLRVRAALQILCAVCQHRDRLFIITTSMNSFHCARELLWRAGFAPASFTRGHADGQGGVERWTCGSRICDVAVIVYDDYASADFARYLAMSAHRPAAVLNDRGPLLIRQLWPTGTVWPPPKHSEPGFLEVFVKS